MDAVVPAQRDRPFDAEIVRVEQLVRGVVVVVEAAEPDEFDQDDVERIDEHRQQRACETKAKDQQRHEQPQRDDDDGARRQRPARSRSSQ